mgnify:FL=1
MNYDEHVAEVVALFEDGMTSVGTVKVIDENWDNVEEFEDAFRFSVYPNPANDVVKVSTDNRQQTTVRIYNFLGMLVEEIEIISNETEINVSDYNPGIYFFSIDGKTKKVVIN